MIQLLIKPKRRRQFGSDGCTEKEYQFTPKRTYVALLTYGCNTSTVMYKVNRRLTVAQTVSPALSTQLIMDMNSGFGQRSDALAAGQGP